MDQRERDRIPSQRFTDRPPTDVRHPERLRLPGVLGTSHTVVSGERLLGVRAVVVVAAGTGLRQGELFGLTVDRLDFLRRELRVDRQLWSPWIGRPVFAAPKSKASCRTVALSQVVVEALAGGDYIRAAVKRAALSSVTWHSLRHCHASTLLSAGVSPALVAERLGHDIQTLMRTYAHVVRSDDDRVRAVVDEHLGVSAEDFLRTEGPRGVPYIGPDLRKRSGTTSTPRSGGCPWSCGGRG
jgi:integrase